MSPSFWPICASDIHPGTGMRISERSGLDLMRQCSESFPPSLPSFLALLLLPHSLSPITLHDNNPIWCRRLRLIDTQKRISRLLLHHMLLSSKILHPSFVTRREPATQPSNRPTEQGERSFFLGYSSNLKFELVNSRCNPKQVGNPLGGISLSSLQRRRAAVPRYTCTCLRVDKLAGQLW